VCLKDPPVYRPLIPVAARYKAWVCGRSLAGIVGSNPAEGMYVGLLWVLCVLSGVGWSPIQSNPTEWSVSECERESSIMRRPVSLGALPFICTDNNIQLNGNVWIALIANCLKHALFLVTVKTLYETLMEHPYWLLEWNECVCVPSLCWLGRGLLCPLFKDVCSFIGGKFLVVRCRQLQPFCS